MYLQPNLPLQGTAGAPGRWTQAYGQLRIDYRLSPNVSLAAEAVASSAGLAIKAAGGKDSNYLGLAIGFGW